MSTAKKISLPILFIGVYLSVQFFVVMLLRGVTKDLMFFSAVSSALTLAIFLKMAKQYELKTFDKRTITLKKIFIAIGLFILTRFITVAILNYLPNTRIINQENIESMFYVSSPILSFLTLVILGPIVEEILFRSVFIQNVFKERQWVGLLLSSALFSSAHGAFTLTEFVIYFSMGIMLGLVYMKTKSLECAIFIHMFNNFIAFIAMMGWI